MSTFVTCFKKDVQKSIAERTMRALENITYGEKLSHLRLFNLEKKMSRRGIITVFGCVKMLLLKASE